MKVLLVVKSKMMENILLNGMPIKVEILIMPEEI